MGVCLLPYGMQKYYYKIIDLSCLSDRNVRSDTVLFPGLS